MSALGALDPQQQLQQLARAMALQNTARAEQAERTLTASGVATQAADEAIAARDAMIAQLQAQLEETRSSLQDRITVLERTSAIQQAQITELETWKATQTKIAALELLEAADTCKMQRFLGEFTRANKDIARHTYPTHIDQFLKDPNPCCNQVPVQIQALQTLIHERCARPIDSVLDVPLQNADTEKLRLVGATVMRAVNTHYPNTHFYGPSSVAIRKLFVRLQEEILTPLINERNARVR